MAEIKIPCFSCGKELSFVDSISRRDECPHCRADARTCKNCTFYDPKIYNECRETTAEVIREKERANLCDYFQAGTKTAGNKSREDLLKAAEALFKK